MLAYARPTQRHPFHNQLIILQSEVKIGTKLMPKSQIFPAVPTMSFLVQDLIWKGAQVASGCYISSNRRISDAHFVINRGAAHPVCIFTNKHSLFKRKLITFMYFKHSICFQNSNFCIKTIFSASHRFVAWRFHLILERVSLPKSGKLTDAKVNIGRPPKLGFDGEFHPCIDIKLHPSQCI